jgi:cell division protein FtsW
VKKKPFDFYFFVLVISLLAMGLIMVFSASSEAARVTQGNAYHFIQRQMIWAVIGLGAMFFMTNFHYKKLQRLALPILVMTLFLLVVVLFFPPVNGARRWISLGFMGFQPSEVAKVAVVIFFAHALSMNYKKLKFFWKGLVPYLLVLAVIAGFLMLQPHFSAVVVIVIVGSIVLLIAGAKIWHFIGLGILATPVAIWAIVSEPYRMQRITAFIDPFKDKLGDGWQIIQSLYAIGSGGIFGLGLGRSRQKFLYIPEPHNDFIFSILAEELGLIGVTVVIGLFMMLVYRGIKIAMNAPDMFASLAAIGIISLVAVQVIINIAVVTSVMPVTGMPLPFFSYGGTTLLINMMAMGIMMNISRYSKG